MANNSQFDLCSAALLLLGAKPISAFTGDTGAIAERLYDSVTKGIASSYPWRFMRQYSSPLARLTATPVIQYLYYYRLPSDIEGLAWALYDDDSQDAPPFKNWEQVGASIATDAAEVWIKYSALPEVPQWPGYFQQLVIYALAAEFAMPVRESSSTADYWRGVAFGRPAEGGRGGYWKVATGSDAKGSPASVQRDNPFIDCR